jgi:flagellar assembly factor FliW
MKLQTRAFGEIEIDEAKTVRMTEPMPGFPMLKRFAVLDPDPENPFKWFQAVDDPDVCFLISDPKTFFPDYRVKIHVANLPDLEIEQETDTIVAVIVNLGGDPSHMTANLRAPLVFNLRKNLCRQIILDNVEYKVRMPLFPQAAA